MAVPVYFNELSLRGYITDGEEWDVVHMLVNVLKSLKRYGIETIRTNEDFVNARISPRISLNDVFRHNGRKIDQDDIALMTTMLTTTTHFSFREMLEEVCVTSASYNGVPVLGLAVASQYIDEGICLSLSQTQWTNNTYLIDLTFLDENLSEQKCLTETQNVCSVEDVEQCLLLKLPQVTYPTSGTMLNKQLVNLFPHLKFSELAMSQLKKIKSSELIQQIIKKLNDIEEAALKITSNVLQPSLFKYRANPESETRKNNIPDLNILFEDGKKRLCSWHEYYTPGAGRIYFCSDKQIEQTIFVGYIGEKLAKT